MIKVYTAEGWRRVFAWVIDSSLSSLFYLPIWVQLGFLLGPTTQHTLSLSLLLLCFALQFCFRWMVLYFLAASPGKLLFGLRVVNAHEPESPLGLTQSFLRVLADHLSLFFGDALRILAWFRFDRTHVSDWVAETRVVQDWPRKRIPRRRILVASLGFIFLLQSGWSQAYFLFRRIDYKNGVLVVLSTHNANR